MTTWEHVHAGDVVLGHDGEQWGVESVAPHPAGPVVTLVRHGARTTGQPRPGTPITVVESTDVTAEAQAFGVLAAAGLRPELLRESYQP